MPVIAVANQKGGVAKTSTVCAVSAGLRRRGYSVLAIDFDPQGNLSDGIGADNYNSPTVYEMLRGEMSAAAVVQKNPAFDVIPANINLASADVEFTMIGKEFKLKERLDAIRGDYDFIFLDTPPSLGILTTNAFTCADGVLIPTTAGVFAANGISQLYSSVSAVKQYCNAAIKIYGILFTRYDHRTNISKDVKELTMQLGEHFQAPVFETFIRNGVAIEEAHAEKQDIFTYSPKSNVAQDYDAFIDEFLERLKNG